MYYVTNIMYRWQYNQYFVLQSYTILHFVCTWPYIPLMYTGESSPR